MDALFAMKNGPTVMNSVAKIIKKLEDTAEPIIEELFKYVKNSNKLLNMKIDELDANIQEIKAATYEAHKHSLPEVIALQKQQKQEKEEEEKKKKEEEIEISKKKAAEAKAQGLSPLSLFSSKITGKKEIVGGKRRSRKRLRSKKYKSKKNKLMYPLS